VFSCSYKELKFVLDHESPNNDGYDNQSPNHEGWCVKLRGLPYQCDRSDIENFFEGLDIAGHKNAILLPLDGQGRSTGDAFVEFQSERGQQGALEKHRNKIGHRYIEIFKALKDELVDFTMMHRNGGRGSMRGRPSPYDRPMRGPGPRGGSGPMGGGPRGRRGGFNNGRGDCYNNSFYDDDFNDDDDEFDYDDGYNGRGNMRGNRRNMGGDRNRGGYQDDYDDYNDYDDEDDFNQSNNFIVFMRGLPFRATDDEITDFFLPVVPLRIQRMYGNDGRVSGECEAEFANYQDAQAAMEKNKNLIQTRYIELFYRGQQGSGGGHRNMGGRGPRGGGRRPPQFGGKPRQMRDRRDNQGSFRGRDGPRGRPQRGRGGYNNRY